MRSQLLGCSVFCKVSIPPCLHVMVSHCCTHAVKQKLLELNILNQSINQSKRKTSNANGQTNLGHKHKAPDHNHEATQPMVDLPHTS